MFFSPMRERRPFETAIRSGSTARSGSWEDDVGGGGKNLPSPGIQMHKGTDDPGKIPGHFLMPGIGGGGPVSSPSMIS